MKNILKRAVCLAVSFVLLCSMAGFNSFAASKYKKRTDFVWGVNGHHQGYAAYPIRSLEDQIRLAAELGVEIYRYNYNPTNYLELETLDEVVDLATSYGLKLMLVMDSYDGTASEIETRFKNVAARYKAKIPYIQVFNEIDVACMQGGTGGNGDTSSGYNMTLLNTVTPKFKAAIKGIRAGYSKTKAVVNISYRHTYLFTHLKNNGISWDITGIDWYQNMGYEGDDFKTGGYDYIIPKLENFGKDIIICETNIWPSNSSKLGEYESDTSYLPKSMEYVYSNYSSVKGMIFYELLDEPNYQMKEGKYNAESHFGLVRVTDSFSIGTPKPIYYKIQQLLGGGTVKPTTTSSSSNTTSSKKPASTASSASKTQGNTSKPTVTSATQSTATGGTAANSAVANSASSKVNSSVSSAGSNENSTSTEGIDGASQQSTSSIEKAETAKKKNGLSTGAVVGIVIGLVILIGGGVTGFVLYKKKK